MEKISMKRTVTFVAAVLAMAFLCAPQSAQRAQKSPGASARASGGAPTAQQIISKYVLAIGGESAHRKLNSRVVKGTFAVTELENLTGTFEAYEKAPNKFLVVLNFPGLGVSREGYDGTGGWSQEPQEAARVLTGAELASAKVDSDFYKDIRLQELFPRLTFKGTEKVGGRTAYKLEGVSRDGYSEVMYFDAASGLLVRTDSTERGPEGAMVIEIQYEDYREIDGIKMAFAARHKSPEMTIIMKITEVRHNVPIEDAMFEKPAAR